MTSQCVLLLLVTLSATLRFSHEAAAASDDDVAACTSSKKADADQRKMSKFATADIAKICRNAKDWRDGANHPARPYLDTLTPEQRDYVLHVWTCNGAECFSNELYSKKVDKGAPGRKKRQGFTKCLRREYRTLTAAERNAFHTAVCTLKTTMIGTTSQYDLLANYHLPSASPAAHGGPAFLPWHREYLRQFEVALRIADPSVCLPYWDFTDDRGLANPATSNIWCPTFMRELSAVGSFSSCFPGVSRTLNPTSVLPSWADLVTVLFSQPNFLAVNHCPGTAPMTLENLHGIPHVFVGGFMGGISTAPQDPTFYLLHGFIDSLWEQFRQTVQTSDFQRENEYPAVGSCPCCIAMYGPSAPMNPFPGKVMKDGLSMDYINNWYTYEPRPTCTGTPSCPPNLFCGTAAGQPSCVPNNCSTTNPPCGGANPCYVVGYGAGYSDGYTPAYQEGYQAGYVSVAGNQYHGPIVDSYNDGYGAAYRDAYVEAYTRAYSSAYDYTYGPPPQNYPCQQGPGYDVYNQGYNTGQAHAYSDAYGRGYDRGYDTGTGPYTYPNEPPRG